MKMSGRMDLEDRESPKREHSFQFRQDVQVKTVTPGPYRRFENASTGASGEFQSPKSFSYSAYALLELQTVRKFRKERRKYLDAIHRLLLDPSNQEVTNQLVGVEIKYYERLKYLRPIHRRLLELQNQHATGEVAQILKEIYDKYEEDLKEFHRRLLELHEYDVTSKLLGILRDIYDEREKYSKASHRRLLRLYQRGATGDEYGNSLLEPSRHDATIDLFEALTEIHDEQDKALQRLHSSLLDRPRLEAISRLLDRPGLKAIDASLGARAGNYQSGKDLKVFDGRLRKGPRYKGTAFRQLLETLQRLYDSDDFETNHHRLLELCKPNGARESLACDSRATIESSIGEEIGQEASVRDSISKPVDPTSFVRSRPMDGGEFLGAHKPTVHFLDLGGVSVQPSLQAGLDDNSKFCPRDNVESVYPEFDLGRIDSIDEPNHDQTFHRGVTSLFQDDDVQQEIPIEHSHIMKSSDLQSRPAPLSDLQKVVPLWLEEMDDKALSLSSSGDDRAFLGYKQVSDATLGLGASKLVDMHESRSTLEFFRRAIIHVHNPIFILAEAFDDALRSSSWIIAKGKLKLRFLEPRLEQGKIRVRWRCVSVQI
jgi:hypothetical protein